MLKKMYNTLLKLYGTLWTMLRGFENSIRWWWTNSHQVLWVLGSMRPWNTKFSDKCTKFNKRCTKSCKWCNKIFQGCTKGLEVCSRVENDLSSINTDP